MKNEEFFKSVLIWLAIIGKSLFQSTVSIVWGIAGILLLGILITQYIPDSQAVYNLQNTARLIYEDWGLFWAFFFGLDILSAYKEVTKE